MTWWQAALSTVPAMVMLGVLFQWLTRVIVREEIAKLNGTYLRKELADQKFDEIEKHFDYLRDHPRKAHSAD